jgi:hypothetical protein
MVFLERILKEFFASEIFLNMYSAAILCLDEDLAFSVGLFLAEDFFVARRFAVRFDR